ncbi:hypothetical protein GO986_12530 [Deinococcus sp. HMF7620]|uniref:Tyr recombinase domain-containing protein n=1 Tax=Deinococcus arboris TaxID=2682977 RepID=A0A7C9HS98_9DEIO|nr:hypothetical protein [Deinococcus arboris]MVN87592.1 hypothetical protein [Deinococcus arboris]
MPPEVSPDHDDARLLLHALQHYDLDVLLTRLGPSSTHPRAAALQYTRLLPFFSTARLEGIDFQRPPASFHLWVNHVALLGEGGRPVKPNTARARISALHLLYESLIDCGVLTTNPLRGLQRPPQERTSSPPPPASEIQALLQASRRQHALHAALTLLYHHAFRLEELLKLQWQAIRLNPGEVLRAHTITRLDDSSVQSLLRWQAHSGGVFSDPQARVFPYETPAALRQAAYLASLDAEIRLFPLRELRRASLRDFPHTSESAGYADDQSGFQIALALAQGVTQSLSPSEKKRKDSDNAGDLRRDTPPI